MKRHGDLQLVQQVQIRPGKTTEEEEILQTFYKSNSSNKRSAD